MYKNLFSKLISLLCFYDFFENWNLFWITKINFQKSAGISEISEEILCNFSIWLKSSDFPCQFLGLAIFYIIPWVHRSNSAEKVFFAVDDFWILQK